MLVDQQHACRAQVMAALHVSVPVNCYRIPLVCWCYYASHNFYKVCLQTCVVTADQVILYIVYRQTANTLYQGPYMYFCEEYIYRTNNIKYLVMCALMYKCKMLKFLT